MTADNKEVVKNSEIVWIATKPHAVAPVLREISSVIQRDQLFVSMAAGTTLRSLAKVRSLSLYLSFATPPPPPSLFLSPPHAHVSVFGGMYVYLIYVVLPTLLTLM